MLRDWPAAACSKLALVPVLMDAAGPAWVQVPQGLRQLRCFSTADLAVIEQDRSITLSSTAQVCECVWGGGGAWHAQHTCTRLVSCACVGCTALASIRLAAGL
jgi:hypothetical protein